MKKIKLIGNNLFARYHISSGFKRYFANTSWIMLEKILLLFIQLFVGIYVLKYLGPKQFGFLAYASDLGQPDFFEKL